MSHTIMKVELTKEQASFLKSFSNALFFNGEDYGYYRLPWVKLSIGSNIGEFYVFEKDYPADLKKVLDDEKEMIKSLKSEEEQL